VSIHESANCAELRESLSHLEREGIKQKNVKQGTGVWGSETCVEEENEETVEPMSCSFLYKFDSRTCLLSILSLMSSFILANVCRQQRMMKHGKVDNRIGNPLPNTGHYSTNSECI